MDNIDIWTILCADDIFKVASDFPAVYIKQKGNYNEKAKEYIYYRVGSFAYAWTFFL